jgi:hypothetical protein
MRHLSFEIVSPALPPPMLPATIRQSTPRLASLAAVLMLMLIVATLIAPMLAIAVQLTRDPSARDIVAAQPGSVLQIGLGLAVWMLLFGWPLSRMAQRVAAERSIRLSATAVEVDEKSVLGRWTWREPIQAFAGVTHHVRASLSGNRHELILVHPDPRRSVLLAVGDRFSSAEIEHICALLGCQEIPARSLYHWPFVAGPDAAAHLKSSPA